MQRKLHTATSGDFGRRRALVLIAVLIAIIILSLLGYQYLDLMTQEYRTAVNVKRTTQSRMLAQSGINYVAALLSKQYALETMNGDPYNNPDLFSNHIVFEDPTTGLKGMFTIMAPMQIAGKSGNEGQIRYGVIDESSKININAMMRIDKKGEKLYEMLLKLPNMDEVLAASIVDWLDEDSEPREGGGEDEVYTSMDPPYLCKNGPLESLDELLWVQGMTPEVLFGNDLNRNGMIDGNEESTDPLLDLGLSAYLTIYSREMNITKDYKLRVNVNEKDLAALHRKLTTVLVGNGGRELANYIILYRNNGGKKIETSSDSGSSSGSGGSSGSSGSGSGSGSGSSSTGGEDLASVTDQELNLTGRGRNKLKSLFDLLNSEVTVRGSGGNSSSKVYASPLNSTQGQETLLPLVFEKLTLSKDTDIPARININTAPEPVLACLPELTEEDVQQIASKQPAIGSNQLANPIYQTPAWLLTQAKLKADAFSKLEKYVTTNTQVYRVHVLGHIEGSSSYTRLEAVIDTNAGRPRVLFIRDLTVLGRGFPMPGLNLK